MFSDIDFEVVCEQWRPKIEQFSRQYVPHMDQDDVRQEMELTLFKCMVYFDPDNKKKVKFHTYLHSALNNRLINMRRSFHSNLNKKTGKVTSQREFDPRNGVYLSQVIDDEESDSPLIDRAIPEDLTVDFSASLDFYAEDMGFTPIERVWLMGRVEKLTVREIAEVFQVPEASVKDGYKSATKKIQRIRRDAELCHRYGED